MIERVHTDVDEMVPVAPGGAGGHLGGSGVGGGGLVPHGARGSNGWLNGELARQVHGKFEDMVRQSPAPTRAERSAYDELVRSFPPPESRGRLALGDGSEPSTRNPAGSHFSPSSGGYSAPWMNGGAAQGGDALGLGGDGRYPSRLGQSPGDDSRPISGSPNLDGRSIFSDLKSPPPSMRRASGGGAGAGSGFTLDDLILRKKGPDAARRSRGAIFSPPPSPPGGRGRRGRKPGAGAAKPKKPNPPPEPSESSSETSEDADEDADDDYASPVPDDRASPLEKLARAAEKRGATRAGASPRSPRGTAKGGLRNPVRNPKPHRIGDSDSDDDGNKIAAVRAGRAKGSGGGSIGGKRGSREARQLLIAAQRMARVTGGGGGSVPHGAVGPTHNTTPGTSASPSALRGISDTPASTLSGRSGGRSTRERRAPSAFWLNEDAKRKDPFATTTAAAASAAAESKKTAARAKPGPKAKPAAKRGRPKSKAKPAAKRRRDDDDDDESSSSESESESEESEEEETLEARAARTSEVKKSAAKKSAVKSPAKRPRGRSPTRGPTRARPAKKPSKSLAVYSESEDATDEDEDEEDEEDEDEDDDVPPPKGDDDTEESDGDDTEESDEDSEDDTPLASRYKGKPSKAAASPKGKKPPPAAKPKPSPKPAKPSPGKGNRRHSAEHAAALVSAEIMGRKTSMARRFGLNVARVVDSEAESSDDDEEEGEDGDDATPPGSTPTDRSSDRTEASSPATATTDADGGAADTTDADDTPATKGSGGQPPRSIEKGKRGGWRPGAGRPRKVYDPNDPTPRKRRRLPGEPPRKRGRPRKHPTAEDIEAGHIRRKPASAEEKAAALRRLGGGGIFGEDVATPKPRGRPRKDGSSKSAPPKPPGPDKKPRETPAPAVRANAISTERWAARVKKAFAGGNAEASHPDSAPRRREVSFPENEGEGAAGAEPRDGAASAPRSAPAPPPSGPYGSDRENEQVSAAKSSRRKSILRTLGKSLGEENEREARRNALNRRFSDVPEFEVFGFQGTPEKGGAASPDFGGSPGLFTAKSPGGLISQLDTDTPVTSPVRSSPRLRG